MQGVLSSGGLMEGLVMRAPCFMQDMMVCVGGGGGVWSRPCCVQGCWSVVHLRSEVVVLCVAVGV